MAVNSDTITGEAFYIIFNERSIPISYKPTKRETESFQIFFMKPK